LISNGKSILLGVEFSIAKTSKSGLKQYHGAKKVRFKSAAQTLKKAVKKVKTDNIF
jgi:hypothetical protein